MKKNLFNLFSVLIIIFAIVMLAIGADKDEPSDRGLKRHQTAGLTCNSCHEEVPPSKGVSEKKCLTCHGDLEKLMKSTINADPNPHASPHLDPRETPKCGDCHRIHKTPTVSCIQCHPEFKFNVK